MSEGRDRTGETYQLATVGREDAVQVFLVVTSRPGMVPGNWRDRPGYRHDIVILDGGEGNDHLSGRLDVIYETHDNSTFTEHYKQIGSDLPEKE